MTTCTELNSTITLS